ncbi:dihydrofolate reductase family protein [Schlegelella sp. S2-27]|uniref:Dihydrofolate reductase family protein n=1 Tax=Caldimonas mangrovi TaxID=2944811 RepID=A0ABT0YSZ4_9BURK|nr:dihydrofolate reductase family protein [Caldimonas mangrovi]MCM5681850.1 dihydrofolate reductase family protein [Caldimonas mangrovi]
MSRLRIACFAISVDGYGAGPRQSLEQPLGENGEELHPWAIATRHFQQMHGSGTGGSTGVDNRYVERGFDNVGAWILGRNMFGPVRGPWPDDHWRGWWGDEPPYHTPVFVLTHHARPPLEMKGGTVFHFVTDGIEAALARAKQAAGSRDVRLGGGVATLRQYLAARLVDEAHLAIAPVLLGTGEPLFAGLDLRTLGYACTEHVAGEKATHVVFTRQP